MKERENFDHSFEKEWGESFEGFEQSPPPSVWSEIEKSLAYSQLDEYKKKARYYKIAVAALLLLASFFGLAYFQANNGLYNQTTEIAAGDPIPSADVKLQGDRKETNPQAVAAENRGSDRASGQKRDEPSKEKISYLSDEHSGLVKEDKSTSGREGSGLITASDEEQDLHFFIPEGEKPDRIDPRVAVAAHYENIQMYAVADYSAYHRTASAEKQDRDRNDERFWAGVNMGSGNFDPNYKSAGDQSLKNNFTPDNNFFSASGSEAVGANSPNVRQGMNSGGSYNLGINMGVRLGGKWVIEGGVQYARTQAVTETNMLIDIPNQVEPIPASAEVRSVAKIDEIIEDVEVIKYREEDVDLQNQFQFATLPVKAGFILLDRKFNIMINAGFITNLYMGNRLKDPNGEVPDITVGPGADSPYRRISFSGSSGIQFGYNLFDQFDLTVEPYYQQAINPLTKEESNFVTSPSGLGITTGLRYRFQ